MKKMVLEGVVGSWDLNATDIGYELDNCDEDIEVYASSGGGSSFEGILIHNKFKNYKNGKVTMINTGICASAMSYILLAGDEIKAYSNATLMVHNVHLLTYGDQHALLKDSQIVARASAVYRQNYAHKMKISDDEAGKLLDAETFYFGKDELLASGIFDEIIDMDGSDSPVATQAEATKSFEAANTSYLQHSKDAKELDAVACVGKNCKVKLEKTKPTINTKEVEIETKNVEALASKVRGFKARLNLKSKGITNG